MRYSSIRKPRQEPCGADLRAVARGHGVGSGKSQIGALGQTQWPPGTKTGSQPLENNRSATQNGGQAAASQGGVVGAVADLVGCAWSTLGKRGALRRPRSAPAATFASIRPELLVDRLLERPWAGDGECAVVGTGLIDGGPAGVAEGGGDLLGQFVFQAGIVVEVLEQLRSRE